MDYASPMTTKYGRRFGRGIFGWVLFIGLAIMIVAPGSNRPFALKRKVVGITRRDREDVG